MLKIPPGPPVTDTHSTSTCSTMMPKAMVTIAREGPDTARARGPTGGPDEGGQQHRGDRRRPARRGEPRGGQSRRVRAERVEAGMAERDLAGKAGEHVEAGGDDGQKADAARQVQIVRVGGQGRQRERGGGHQRPADALHYTRLAGGSPSSPHGRATRTTTTSAKPTISRAPVET